MLTFCTDGRPSELAGARFLTVKHRRAALFYDMLRPA